MIDLSVHPHARVYLWPVQLADSPVGLDGRCLRLAGGLVWFMGVRVIVADAGTRLHDDVVPVAALDETIAALPDKLAEQARTTLARLSAPRAPLTLGDRVLRFDQPLIAGILNVTPDSFSDGRGLDKDPAAAAEAGVRLASEGAALIDIGGESTRPGATTVWEGDEIARVVPVVERLAKAGVAVSIDTRKAAVMEAALAAGAHLVNDVGALAYDERALEVVAKAGCPVVLMHSRAPAKGPHETLPWSDPALEVYDWLEERIDAVVAGGVDRAKILVDPGIGFGKTVQVNLALINALALFQGLGCAVMLGASRKRMIGALSNEAGVSERLAGSIALAMRGVDLGVQLLRVHDVADTAQAVRVWRGLRDAALIR